MKEQIFACRRQQEVEGVLVSDYDACRTMLPKTELSDVNCDHDVTGQKNKSGQDSDAKGRYNKTGSVSYEYNDMGYSNRRDSNYRYRFAKAAETILFLMSRPNLFRNTPSKTRLSDVKVVLDSEFL